MEINEEKINQNSDEISVKEILLKVKEYMRFFWSKKLYFIVPFILFVSFFIYKAKTAPWLYRGETKFFLEGSNGAGAGGIGGLLGQIAGGGSKTNPFRVIEVAESKIQMSEILFEKIGQDSAFIANKILEVYDLPATWSEDDPKYQDFKFTHDSVENFSKLENTVLIKLIRKVVNNVNGDALMTIGIEDDRGYYFINVKTLSHDLTLKLSEVSYDNLKYFFEEKTRSSLKVTRDVLKIKSDSIKGLLDNKISQLANYKDRNKSIVYNREQVKEVILTGEIQGLNAAYLETVKAFEVADYKYIDRSEYFMLIDKPMAPLGLVFKNWKIEAVKGGILAIFLSFGLLFLFKLYTDIMES